jgi:hypothetical protein
MNAAWVTVWPYLITALLVGVAIGLGVCSLLHANWGLR